MVNAGRARDIESRLIMLARTNQLRSRISEEELIKLIGMVDETKKPDEKIVFSRRKGVLDDDDLFE
jgi:DNA-binding TFAR19-related protein (PDSD5 family)